MTEASESPAITVTASASALYTDLGNAKWFAAMHRNNVRWVQAWDCWMCWNGKYWEERDPDQMSPYVEEMSKAMIKQALENDDIHDKFIHEKAVALKNWALKLQDDRRLKNCVKYAKNEPLINASPSDFDKNIYLFNFDNGTIDLSDPDPKILTHRREDMLTRISPRRYASGAPCPLWLDFLHRIFEGDHDVIRYIQKFFGMSLTGDVSEELFHVFYGLGANGKTTLLSVIDKVIGEMYFRTVAVETLLKRGQRTIASDVARLRGARVAWANEPEFDDVLTQAKIKKMTSKERILGEKKYKDEEEFMPEYHLILTTNMKPRMQGTDYGFRRRLRFVPFNYKFKEDEKDIHFTEKLDAELEGIASWLVEGCKMWKAEGLTPPEKILQATFAYQEEMDKLDPFFRLLTVADVDAKIPLELIYTVYRLWSVEEELQVVSKVAFTQMMIQRGYTKLPHVILDGTNRAFRGYGGLALINTHEFPLMTYAIEYLSAYNTAERDEKYSRMVELIRRVTNPLYVATDARDLILDIVRKEFQKYDFAKGFGHDRIIDQMYGKVIADYPFEYPDKPFMISVLEQYYTEKMNGVDFLPQVDKIKTVMEIVRGLQANNGNTATLADVLAKAVEAGMKAETAKDMIEKLKFRGELIEMIEGRYRCV